MWSCQGRLAAALTLSDCAHTSGAFGAWSNGMVACWTGWYPLTCWNRTWVDNRYGTWSEPTKDSISVQRNADPAVHLAPLPAITDGVE